MDWSKSHPSLLAHLFGRTGSLRPCLLAQHKNTALFHIITKCWHDNIVTKNKIPIENIVWVANSPYSILCYAWTKIYSLDRSNPDAPDYSPTNHAHYDQTFAKQTTNCPSIGIGSTNSCIYPLFFFSPNDDSSMFVMITRSRAKPPNHLCMTLIDCCSPVGATPFRRPRWLWVTELRRLSKAYIPWSKDLSVAATLSWQQCECTATSCIFNHLYYGRIVEWPLILLIECAWAVLAGDRCRRKLVYWSMSEPDDGFLFQLLHAAAGHRIH